VDGKEEEGQGAGSRGQGEQNLPHFPDSLLLCATLNTDNRVMLIFMKI
jgi:hypothetical protein